MRRWEEDRRLKNYKEKIRRAKPVVDTRMQSSLSTKAPSVSIRSTEGGEDRLKSFLKQFHIQQYYKKLIELGFQTNVWRLATLTDKEVEGLNEQLRMLPGHAGKFMEMLRKIRRVYSVSRGRSTAWTAHSLSPRLSTLSPRKNHRTLSHDSSGTALKPSHPRTEPQVSSQSDREESRKLAEELACAKIKIMLLEHELGQKTQSSVQKDYESPQNLSKKSITFNIEEEKPPEKAVIRQKLKQREEIGVSYDSSKMRSTLINLDIEEICRCLAKALKLKVQTEDFRMESQQRHSTRQSSTSSLRYSDSRTLPGAIIGRMEDAFFEPSHQSYSSSEEDIYNFCKNVLIRSKMEKEIPVVLLVYIDRVELKAGVRLTNYTWKRLVFTCMVLASKIWDDDSYENKNFAEAFSIYTIEEINAMEAAVLMIIDFDLNVKGGEYAKAYFLLRTFFDPKNRSFPLKALDVETVRKLQSNAPNAESMLRDLHAEALFKTL